MKLKIKQILGATLSSIVMLESFSATICCNKKEEDKIFIYGGSTIIDITLNQHFVDNKQWIVYANGKPMQNVIMNVETPYSDCFQVTDGILEIPKNSGLPVGSHSIKIEAVFDNKSYYSKEILVNVSHIQLDGGSTSISTTKADGKDVKKWNMILDGEVVDPKHISVINDGETSFLDYIFVDENNLVSWKKELPEGSYRFHLRGEYEDLDVESETIQLNIENKPKMVIKGGRKDIYCTCGISGRDEYQWNVFVNDELKKDGVVYIVPDNSLPSGIEMVDNHLIWDDSLNIETDYKITIATQYEYTTHKEVVTEQIQLHVLKRNVIVDGGSKKIDTIEGLKSYDTKKWNLYVDSFVVTPKSVTLYVYDNDLSEYIVYTGGDLSIDYDVDGYWLKWSDKILAGTQFKLKIGFKYQMTGEEETEYFSDEINLNFYEIANIDITREVNDTLLVVSNNKGGDPSKLSLSYNDSFFDTNDFTFTFSLETEKGTTIPTTMFYFDNSSHKISWDEFTLETSEIKYLNVLVSHEYSIGGIIKTVSGFLKINCQVWNEKTYTTQIYTINSLEQTKYFVKEGNNDWEDGNYYGGRGKEKINFSDMQLYRSGTRIEKVTYEEKISEESKNKHTGTLKAPFDQMFARSMCTFVPIIITTVLLPKTKTTIKFTSDVHFQITRTHLPGYVLFLTRADNKQDTLICINYHDFKNQSEPSLLPVGAIPPEQKFADPTIKIFDRSLNELETRDSPYWIKNPDKKIKFDEQTLEFVNDTNDIKMVTNMIGYSYSIKNARASLIYLSKNHWKNHEYKGICDITLNFELEK